MQDVKWIRLYIDMISNKKIKRIRKLPEGNNIILIWVFLLAQAGESNKNGALYLTEALPFRPEDLAIEFDFDVSIINLALITLEKFEMIEVYENIIYIKNWDEYQNIDGLDKIKEQTRLRVEKYRNKQKLLSSNVSCNVTVTDSNATDIDIDKELDKELEIDKRNNIIMSQFESEYISILEKIKDYPIDRQKDIEYLKALSDRYPVLDMISVAKEFSLYILANPFKKKSNARSQLNTSCQKYKEWGKCLKTGGGQNSTASNQGNQSICNNTNEYEKVGFTL